MSAIASSPRHAPKLFLIALFAIAGCSAATNPPDHESTAPVASNQDTGSGVSLLDLPDAKVVRDAAGQVVQLDLRGCRFGDAEMQSLQALDSLTVLRLSGKEGGCTVTDAGLQAISGLTNLKVLALDLLPVSGTGLQHLVKLNHLQELYLAKTDIDDQASELLENFPRLKKLRLAGAPIATPAAQQIAKLVHLVDLDVSDCEGIGDDAAAQLAKLPRIEKLNLYLSTVGDAGATSLAKCQSLRWLNLDATRVSDAGLAEIGKLAQLQFLHLGSTSISDDGLPHLAQLSKLEKLIVTRTKVTQAGGDKLQESLPNTEIQLVYIAPE